MVNFIKKFKRAFVGFREVLWPEPSIKIELAVGILVLVVAWLLRVSQGEFLTLLVTAAAVILVEGLNTVLERTVDLVEPRYHQSIRELKDALAGLVMMSIIIAAVIGAIIFLPHLKLLIF